jgi:hypothetical protein
MLAELRELRRRIEELERQLMGVRLPRSCAYCGAPTRAGVCRAHADLMQPQEGE